MADQTPHLEPKYSATGSLDPEYFDRLYAARPDPWDFATSAYEAEKYAATLTALPRAMYGSVLELGCSIGVLTRQLAPRCERLLATDVSKSALQVAMEKCRDFPQVSFAQSDLAAVFPAGLFDLILVSEVAYYLSLADLVLLRGRIAKALTPGGHLLLVHYTGGTNYPLTADEVHDTFREWSGRAWRHLESWRADQYRMDLWEGLESPILGG